MKKLLMTAALLLMPAVAMADGLTLDDLLQDGDPAVKAFGYMAMDAKAQNYTDTIAKCFPTPIRGKVDPGLNALVDEPVCGQPRK